MTLSATTLRIMTNDIQCDNSELTSVQQNNILHNDAQHNCTKHSNFQFKTTQQNDIK